MKRKILILTILSSFILSINAQNKKEDKEIKLLKKYLYTLASEETKGREPGTKGSLIASDFIFDQFKKMKLEVSLSNGFQNFDIINDVELNDANSLSIGSFKPKFKTDYTVYSYSVSDTLSCTLVFAGYGFELKNDSVSWDDYKSVDVNGKCVLIFRGDPEYDKSISAFVGQGGERNKAILAKSKGAKAVIFVSPVNVDKSDELLSYRSYQGDVGIPVLQVKRAVADSILKKSNTSVGQVEQKIKEQKSPYTFDVTAKIDVITGLTVKKAKTRNILAVLPGSDPVLKNEFIVVGAHYDHLGMGGRGSSSMRPDTIGVHYGADDNASGVTTILGIANEFVKNKTLLKRSILFLAFDAEEEGLLGSKYFLNNPLVPVDKIKAMFNYDMVGRMKDDKTLQFHGTGTSVESDSILKKVLLGYNFKTSFDPQGNGPSDYAAFYNKNIPVIAFTTGVHPDYHTPADRPEKINYEGIKEIIDFSEVLIAGIANRNAALTFKQVSSPSENKNVRRGKVALGIMPDFSGADNGGVRVDGVSKGKPAEKAGILKDDLITAINGEKIKDIYEYMFQMAKFSVGDKITVEIKRKDQVLNIEVNL